MTDGHLQLKYIILLGKLNNSKSLQVSNPVYSAVFGFFLVNKHIRAVITKAVDLKVLQL